MLLQELRPDEPSDDRARSEHRHHEQDPRQLGVLGHHSRHVSRVVVGSQLLHIGVPEQQIRNNPVEAERHPVHDVATYDALYIVIGILPPHDELSDKGAHDGDGSAVEPSHERVEQPEYQRRARQHASLADAVRHHHVERRGKQRK
ncbi:hypothetical protein HMPREF1248_0843 [Coriobacteriaceae bacterium BV3Ac1]|nr:hypothetical protein HMPREF1248_0843 [Coriobacteriaceae bacterium BV3Ac1]